MFKIWQGGMAFHGGLIGGTIMMFVFARKHNLKFLEITDWVSPSLPIALFLGRSLTSSMPNYMAEPLMCLGA